MCDWLWVMRGACLLVAIGVDGGGVAELVPNLHLHSVSALHLNGLVYRVDCFLIKLLCVAGCG